MDIDIEDVLFDDAVLSAAIAIVQEEVVRKQTGNSTGIEDSRKFTVIS
jgi:hypothetical protein